jgi:hypothetical protein
MSRRMFHDVDAPSCCCDWWFGLVVGCEVVVVCSWLRFVWCFVAVGVEEKHQGQQEQGAGGSNDTSGALAHQWRARTPS